MIGAWKRAFRALVARKTPSSPSRTACCLCCDVHEEVMLWGSGIFVSDGMCPSCCWKHHRRIPRAWVFFECEDCHTRVELNLPSAHLEPTVRRALGLWPCAHHHIREVEVIRSTDLWPSGLTDVDGPRS
jgi:hypothetical protein